MRSRARGPVYSSLCAAVIGCASVACSGQDDERGPTPIPQPKQEPAAPAVAKPVTSAQRAREQAAAELAAKRDRPPPDPAARQAFARALDQGRKLTKAGDYAGAVAALDQALAAIPHHPRALSARGYARLLASELDLAEADLLAARAGTVAPKLRAAIAYNLGLVAERRGDQDGARQAFAEAYSLNPSKAAQAKLGTLAACGQYLRRGGGPGQVVADWLGVWTLLHEALLAGGAHHDATAPTSAEAARQLLRAGDEHDDPLLAWTAIDLANGCQGEDCMGRPQLALLRGSDRAALAMVVAREDGLWVDVVTTIDEYDLNGWQEWRAQISAGQLLVVGVVHETEVREAECGGSDSDQDEDGCWAEWTHGTSLTQVYYDAETLTRLLSVHGYHEGSAPAPISTELAGRTVTITGACATSLTL